jgi:hypothetical protein
MTFAVVMSFAISVMSVLIFSQLALENICILLQQFDQNNFEGVVVLFSLMIRKKYHIPWLNRSLQRMLRRKARLHKHAKRTGNFKEYRHFQKECKRQFRKAQW